MQNAKRYKWKKCGRKSMSLRIKKVPKNEKEKLMIGNQENNVYVWIKKIIFKKWNHKLHHLYKRKNLPSN
jgi:hypothetical protein